MLSATISTYKIIKRDILCLSYNTASLFFWKRFSYHNFQLPFIVLTSLPFQTTAHELILLIFFFNTSTLAKNCIVSQF